MDEHTRQITIASQPGSGVWLSVHQTLNLLFVAAVTVIALQASVTNGNTDHSYQAQLHCTCLTVVFWLLHVHA